MATYGIDLGTTYSCISRVDESGEPVVIANDVGENTTASVVLFESQFKVRVGRDAKNAARTDPDLVVALIKRDMGKKDVKLTFHGTTYTPESVSALILKDLVRSVQASAGETVRDVVITVPAYFGVVERQATRVAGDIAGLNVLSVVPEPVAAAMFHGVLTPGAARGADRTILVYDLGGGTFDTTVIKLVGDDVTVVCTDGSFELGGTDWDERIATYLFDYFVAEQPDAGADDSEELLQDLMLLAEDLKKSLTTRRTATQMIRFGGRSARAELTREAFEEMTADLLQRSMDITARTIATARGKGVDTIDEVLLVGGSTHMPAVAQRLTRQFGFNPRRKEPDLAVAKGAALYAVHETARTRLDDGSGKRRGVSATKLADELNVPTETVEKMGNATVTTVCPRAFGVKVLQRAEPEPGEQEPAEDQMRLIVEHLLHANTPLPTEPYTRQFGTVVDNQREIQVEIWEQAGETESELLGNNKHIGAGTIRRLPSLRKGSPVDITFQMNVGGTLLVEAVELHSGQRLNIELQIGEMTPKQVAEARDTVSRLT
jgi:molecular chaperone DnaK (HSP70)